MRTFVKTWLAVTAVTLVIATPAHAGPVSGQGTWETTLQARDLDGNGITDAFYDTTLDITWLRDANVNGVKTWDAANTWVSDFSFGSYSDWRLPTMVDTGPPGCDVGYGGGTDCGYNVPTSSGSTVYSEMASLWYDTLGNKAICPPGDATCAGGPQAGWGLSNTGEFQNLESSGYWSGLEYELDTDSAWLFSALYGSQTPGSLGSRYYALAVRPGDVLDATVSEPQSLVLSLTALAYLGWIRRRRAVGPSTL